MARRVGSGGQCAALGTTTSSSDPRSWSGPAELTRIPTEERCNSNEFPQASVTLAPGSKIFELFKVSMVGHAATPVTACQVAIAPRSMRAVVSDSVRGVKWHQLDLEDLNIRTWWLQAAARVPHSFDDNWAGGSQEADDGQQPTARAQAVAEQREQQQRCPDDASGVVALWDGAAKDERNPKRRQMDGVEGHRRSQRRARWPNLRDTRDPMRGAWRYQ